MIGWYLPRFRLLFAFAPWGRCVPSGATPVVATYGPCPCLWRCDEGVAFWCCDVHQLVGNSSAPRVALLLPIEGHYCCPFRGSTDDGAEEGGEIGLSSARRRLAGSSGGAGGCTGGIHPRDYSYS